MDAATARVTVSRNGPYLVQGGVPVRRRQVVRSEQGEALTWETMADLPAGDVYALCRCGGSQNKPFCDGTHARSGFDGTEVAATDAYDERARDYQGVDLVVRDDRSVCSHAGFCGNRISTVWKMVADTESGPVRGQVMAMIEHCPSGALTYRLEHDGPDVEPDLRPAVGIVANGPITLTGGLSLVRANGDVTEVRARVTLCRCGGSGNKPFCDGTHAKNGFQDS